MIITTTDVFCDWCSHWEEGTQDRWANRKKARKKVKVGGWRFRWSVKRQKHEDVCPDCLKELAKELGDD